MPQVQDLNLPSAYREIVNAGLWPSGTYSVDYFGMVPGEDCTDGFAAVADYLASNTALNRRVIVFGPGDFYADKIVFPGESESYGGGGYTIIGAGSRARTRWRANASSEPVFVGNEGGGFIWDWQMSGIDIQGNGAENPNQIVVYLNSEPKTFDAKDSGIRWLKWEDIYIHGGALQQMVIKGGVVDAFSPNDFWTWTNINIERASGNHWPALMVIGQYGQIVWNNTRTGGGGQTGSKGPNLYMGYHPSNTQFVPGSVAADVITTSSAHRTWTGQPIRFVGTTAPAGLSKSTTYYCVPQNKTTSVVQVGVSTSQANAVAGTLATVTDAGTSATAVKLWAESLASDEYTCTFQHLLTTGDPLRILGVNLPSIGGTTPTSGNHRWAIRTGAYTFKLATSLANAKARTAATISGGTLANYGFACRFEDFTSGYSPFQVDLRMHTSEGAEVGAFFQGVWGAQIKPYFENLTFGIEVYGTMDGFPGTPSVSVGTGGRWAAITNSLISESSGILTYFDLDQINSLSSGAYYPQSSSQVFLKNNKQQAVAFSATPTIAWTTGAVVNFGALTAAVTAVTVTGAVAGCKITLNLVQDGTGGRTVALGSDWKGASIGSGTASQKSTVTGTFDGTHWMYTFSAWG